MNSHQLKWDTVIRIDDHDDINLLGNALIALSNTDHDALGARGDCKINYNRGTYVFLFDNGVKLKPIRVGAAPATCLIARQCAQCRGEFLTDDPKLTTCGDCPGVPEPSTNGEREEREREYTSLVRAGLQ